MRGYGWSVVAAFVACALAPPKLVLIVVMSVGFGATLLLLSMLFQFGSWKLREALTMRRIRHVRKSPAAQCPRV